MRRISFKLVFGVFNHIGLRSLYILKPCWIDQEDKVLGIRERLRYKRFI